MYILYNGGFLSDGDRVALTTQKLDFYTNLPGYGLRGYPINKKIVKL